MFVHEKQDLFIKNGNESDYVVYADGCNYDAFNGDGDPPSTNQSWLAKVQFATSQCLLSKFLPSHVFFGFELKTS
jgi:hypothetical protein